MQYLRYGLVAGALQLSAVHPAEAADLPYLNFEHHPIHALDLSPSRQVLAVAHTADQRVQLFDVTQGKAVATGHVVVGVDPVSVRFRNENELWVVNHVSDSVSVIDLATRKVRATLATPDEPFDVVFANGRAFVSASQVNQVAVFELADLSRAPQLLTLKGEDPRALAVSPDGSSVYAAIYESGNATTVLPGGIDRNESGLPNAVSDPRGPYGGVNPPPNVGTRIEPPMNPAAPAPPGTSLIVRRGSDRRWRDDNNRDWTALVSGNLASASGRKPGWDLGDRDIAVINSSNLEIRYVTGLMNIGMALAVQPNGKITLIGTEAFNEIRFEPNVKSRFLEVRIALVTPNAAFDRTLVNLNSHLLPQAVQVSEAERKLAVGDPRAVIWNADGSRGWVAGMGSNNVLEIDRDGRRVGAPIAVGEGPAGLALDEARQRLYVWNHFAASLSVLDISTRKQVQSLAAFNPLPRAIRDGRKFFYDTHLTSGLGQVSCASCHIDGRMDRLAWDLGDPREMPKRFNQNCVTTAVVLLRRPSCEDFHSMKGPMTTQTMQDIIGHEPLHWRGDRDGIEEFNSTFPGLLGDDRPLSAAEMQAFENFLATMAFPPNPYRRVDNSLPTEVPLPGHFSAGRFSMAGIALPTGNAQRGLQLYTSGNLDNPFECASCHTLPTGMGANGPLRLRIGFSTGGTVMPIGPMGENHLGIVSVDGGTNVSMKIPQLRNQQEKVGMEFSLSDNLAGFGFLHDGSVDSLARFFSANVFGAQSDRDLADLIALQLAFSGSDFPAENPGLTVPPPLSKDAHAAVGQQVRFAGSAGRDRLLALIAIARVGKIDLVVHAGRAAWLYQASNERMRSHDGSPELSPELSVDALLARATNEAQVWTAVPRGLGERLALDRDGDGVNDGVELAQGSDPADANSKRAMARAGLWYNPARSGSGFDIQYSGPNQLLLWYTYLADGSPTWYLASGPKLVSGTTLGATPWRADLMRFVWNPTSGRAVGQTVGSVSMSEISGMRASLSWTLGAESGSEPIRWLSEGTPQAIPDQTGVWYRSEEPGWGLTINNIGSQRVLVQYFYDAAQQPRWVLGQGANGAQLQNVEMRSYRGFCPGCGLVPVSSIPGGSAQIDFSAEQTRFSSSVFAAGEANAPWTRSDIGIVPLSDPAIWLEAR